MLTSKLVKEPQFLKIESAFDSKITFPKFIVIKLVQFSNALAFITTPSSIVTISNTVLLNSPSIVSYILPSFEYLLYIIIDVFVLSLHLPIFIVF